MQDPLPGFPGTICSPIIKWGLFWQIPLSKYLKRFVTTIYCAHFLKIYADVDIWHRSTQDVYLPTTTAKSNWTSDWIFKSMAYLDSGIIRFFFSARSDRKWKPSVQHLDHGCYCRRWEEIAICLSSPLFKCQPETIKPGMLNIGTAYWHLRVTIHPAVFLGCPGFLWSIYFANLLTTMV